MSPTTPLSHEERVRDQFVRAVQRILGDQIVSKNMNSQTQTAADDIYAAVAKTNETNVNGIECLAPAGRVVGAMRIAINTHGKALYDLLKRKYEPPNQYVIDIKINDVELRKGLSAVEEAFLDVARIVSEDRDGKTTIYFEDGKITGLGTTTHRNYPT